MGDSKGLIRSQWETLPLIQHALDQTPANPIPVALYCILTALYWNPFQILEKGSPYPLVILPQFGGYWIEDPENLSTPTSSDSSIYEEEEENLSPSTYGYKLECKGEARAYRKHFLGKVSGQYAFTFLGLL